MKLENNMGVVSLNLLKLFETLNGVEIEQNGNDFIVWGDWGNKIFCGCYGELITLAVDSLNDSLESETADLLNNDWSLVSVGDYLPILLSLDYNTTVLPIGNGALSAPNTITALIHTDVYKNQYLAIYDYEEVEKETKKALEEVLPSKFPLWCVVLKQGDTERHFFEEAETKADAVKMALDEFSENLFDCFSWDRITVTEEI